MCGGLGSGFRCGVGDVAMKMWMAVDIAFGGE